MFTLYGNQYESREEHLLLTMFQSVLSAQFETATEFGSLLRANTPVSRMMTTYTRRGPGQSYLKSVLAERINSLIEHKDLNLEINPVKASCHLTLPIPSALIHLIPHARFMNRWLIKLRKKRVRYRQTFPAESRRKLPKPTRTSKRSSLPG